MKNPATLILVEDNPADVHLIRFALEQTAPKVQLMHFADGQSFLQYLEDHPGFRPACLLLDLNLPMLSGHQILENVRRNSKFNYLPIIIFTSSSDLQDVEQAYRLGANAYVKKPLELDDLVDILQTITNFWLKVNLIP